MPCYCQYVDGLVREILEPLRNLPLIAEPAELKDIKMTGENDAAGGQSDLCEEVEAGVAGTSTICASL